MTVADLVPCETSLNAQRILISAEVGVLRMRPCAVLLEHKIRATNICGDDRPEDRLTASIPCFRHPTIEAKKTSIWV